MTIPAKNDHKYTYSHTGYNLKITDWQAACGLAQLKKLDKFIEIRNRNFNYLYEKLKEYHYDVIFGRVHDADHGRSIFYNEDVYQTIIAFLDKHQ